MAENTAWGWGHVVECLCSMHEALGLTPALQKSSVVAYTPDLSIWETEAGGAEVHGHRQPQEELEALLGQRHWLIPPPPNKHPPNNR